MKPECEYRIFDKYATRRSYSTLSSIFLLCLSPSFLFSPFSLSSSPFLRDSGQFYRFSRARGSCKSPERLRLRGRKVDFIRRRRGEGEWINGGFREKINSIQFSGEEPSRVTRENTVPFRMITK